MSYILSALKKADQERQRGAVPNLNTEVDAYPSFKQHKQNRVGLWILAIAALLVFNVLVYQWFNQEPGHRANVTQTNVLAEDASPPSVAPEPIVAREPTVAPQPTADNSAAAILSEPAEVAEPIEPVVMEEPPAELNNINNANNNWATTIPLGRVPDFMELSKEVRGQMPTLQLTGHLYSLAHARARKVIINGTSLREQQYLADDLFVKEITPDGAVLNFRGHFFKLSAAQMFQ